MSHAYDNLDANKLYHQLQLSINGRKEFKDGKIIFEPADDETKAETCYYCHGTMLKVTGTEIRDTELAGELEFPIIEGWPNQGVGRVNPDGSLGSLPAHYGWDTRSAAGSANSRRARKGSDTIATSPAIPTASAGIPFWTLSKTLKANSGWWQTRVCHQPGSIRV